MPGWVRKITISAFANLTIYLFPKISSVQRDENDASIVITPPNSRISNHCGSPILIRQSNIITPAELSPGINSGFISFLVTKALNHMPNAYSSNLYTGDIYDSHPRTRVHSTYNTTIPTIVQTAEPTTILTIGEKQ